MNEVDDWESIAISKGKKDGIEMGASLASKELIKEGHRKGKELGIEYGYYISIVRTLTEWCNAKPIFDKTVVRNNKRIEELENIVEKLEKKNIIHCVESLSNLIDEIIVESFLEDENYSKFLKVRAKFKVLESLLGVTFHIMSMESEASTESASTIEF